MSLRLLRRLSGLSQEAIAGRLGVDRSSVSLYEADKVSIPPDRRDKFIETCAPRIDWSAIRDLESVLK